MRNHIYTNLHHDTEHTIALPWKDEYKIGLHEDWEEVHENKEGLFDSQLTITPLPDFAALQINNQSKEEYKEEFYRVAVMKLIVHGAHEMLTPALMEDVKTAIPPAVMANLKHLELMLYDFSAQIGREDSRRTF